MEFWNFNSQPFRHNLFFHFDSIISMSIPFKGRLFCQNPMYNCGVIGVESWTISHTFAVIFAATAPHPRWRRKPCNVYCTKRLWTEVKSILCLNRPGYAIQQTRDIGSHAESTWCFSIQASQESSCLLKHNFFVKVKTSPSKISCTIYFRGSTNSIGKWGTEPSWNATK